MQPAMNTSLRFREIQRLRNRRFKDLHLSRDHNRTLSSKSAGFYFRFHNTVIPNRIHFSIRKSIFDIPFVYIICATFRNIECTSDFMEFCVMDEAGVDDCDSLLMF